jgi:hypothetical protein
MNRAFELAEVKANNSIDLNNSELAKRCVAGGGCGDNNND